MNTLFRQTLDELKKRSEKLEYISKYELKEIDVKITKSAQRVVLQPDFAVLELTLREKELVLARLRENIEFDAEAECVRCR